MLSYPARGMGIEINIERIKTPFVSSYPARGMGIEIVISF